MKKLFLSMVVMMIATVSFAQNTLVATLSHGEDVSMYYGTYALQNAMNAAKSGDIINLSGGGFQAVNITKGVTLRGTGYNDAVPSSIIGTFTINVASTDTCRLSMEGIRVTGRVTMAGSFSNPYFLKCLFDSGFDYNSSSSISSAMFANCEIWGNDFVLRGSSTVQFINCVVSGFRNYEKTTASAFFLNCDVWPYGYYSKSYAQDINSSQLMNCIIIYDTKNCSYTWSLPSTTTALYCVAVGYNYFQNSQLNTNCKQVASMEAVFVESIWWKGLTDEAKTTYLGDDGTPVGIFGGVMPWNTTPSYPRITKMNVANRTTADGKLSVEIEVSAAE